METLVGGVSKQQPYSPHLKKVLKTYQLTAVKSLQGPSNVLDKGVIVKQEQENVDGDYTSPQLPPIQQLPILTTQDQSRSERSETLLESERISCFIVGGERRLCLPQVLNGVLHDFSLSQINQVCDELHIFCSRCNPEQLDVLKGNGILPMTAPSCGLITKTDAERLCSSLLHHAPAAKAAGKLDRAGMFSFKVYHECFGKCKGLCIPELYTEVDAVCIECLECHGMFSPRRFVCHVHRSPENRTCHWGFDSDNWRYYLQLVRDQLEEEHLMKLLDQIKDQHDEGAIVQAPTHHLKRKQPSADLPAMDRLKAEAESDLHYVMKKAKMDIGPMDPFSYPAYHLYHPDPHNLLWYPWRAFRPSWSSSSKVKQLEPEPTVMLNLPGNLSHSPPVLLFPDRVVPMSQSERFERTFQPNVALAPRQPKQEVKTEALTEPTTMKRPATPPPLPSATLNYEIELSSDTDTDSSVDTLAVVAGQDTAGSCVDIVQQVVSLMSDISDVRVESMRSRVVELVERLSRQLDSVEEDRRSLQRKNARLRERDIEAQKIVEQLRDQLHQQQVKYSDVVEGGVSIKEEPE